MKSLNTITKIFLSTVALAAMHSASAQSMEPGIVWATFNDSQVVPQMIDGKLATENIQLQEIIENLNVTRFEKALPASRTTELQNVYAIECDCNGHELLQEIADLSNMDTRPEVGPHYELLYDPNDFNTEFTEDYALDIILAKQAWDITTGNGEVTIAITDSNYDFAHVDLASKTDLIVNSTNPNIHHGTAVAVTAAGDTDNDYGKSSIGFNSRLQLRPMSYNQMLEAAYSGADIINVSWTSGCFENQYVQDVINEIYDLDVVVVAAAGNGTTCGGPTNLVYPAACENVIGVSSIGPQYNHERVIGDPTTTHQHNASVDICAAGYDVALTGGTGIYGLSSGTSFAAPSVSGVISLMLSVNPCLTPDDVLEILQMTAQDLDAANPDYAGMLGAGLVNAREAVAAANSFETFVVEVEHYIDCRTGLATANYVTNEPNVFEANWSNGLQGSLVDGFGPGTHHVIVVNEEGCSTMKFFTVEAIETDVFEAEIRTPSCVPGNDGKIDLGVGNWGAYQYAWSNGSTQEDINGLAPGDYSVHLIGENGCHFDTTFHVGEPLDIELSCEVSGNNIDLIVDGGEGPFTFQWSNGATTEDLSGVMPGTYQVLVEDALACQATHTSTVQIGIVDGVVYEVNSTASINEIDAASFGIYPNPATNEIRLEFSQGALDQVSILNVTGALVKQMDMNGMSTVDVSDLSAGVYVVKANTKEGLTATSKMQIVR